MTDGQKGVLAMAVAATVWGLSGIYYKALSVVPPLEVLSHRTLWSTVFLGIVLATQGRTGETVALLARPRAWAVLGLSALMIGINWLLFIAAVQGGDALEASLGYYIFPLLGGGARVRRARRAVLGVAVAGDRAGGGRGGRADAGPRDGALDGAGAGGAPSRPTG